MSLTPTSVKKLEGRTVEPKTWSDTVHAFDVQEGDDDVLLLLA